MALLGRIGLLACLTLSACATARQPRVLGMDWVQSPAPIVIARYFPERAIRYKVLDAPVSLLCRVAVSGALSDCQVVGESPKDWGFGAAGLSLSQNYSARVPPNWREGDSVKIEIPFHADYIHGELG